jgi:hypothetical protein
VSVAGDGDASVSMEPEGVTMASSISAAVYVDSQVSTTYQQPSVRCGALNYCKLYHYADGAVPMDQQPSMSREVSMWIVRYLRTMSRPCLLLVMVMHPYRWSLKV